MDNEKTTVLLIEDNPGDARLIQEFLSEAGSDIFRLEHVDRLSLGLERLARGDIGVILLDLSLPDSQGLEGLLKILTKAPDVPVVVLSSIKDEAVAIKAVHEGAQDYLVKGSIDGTLLVRLLRHAIERHHLRVALGESESRYRLLADNIADVVWVADEKGRITYASPSIKRLLGYTVGEVEKLRIRDILTADSAEQARRLIKSQMEIGMQQSQDAALSLTLEHIRKDGSTVWAEVMLSFLLDKKGKFAGIMGATRDITARKIAEEALKESETRFRTVFEGTSMAIALVDRRGKPLGVNPAFSQMFGYSFEEFVKLNNLKYLYPDNAMVDAGLYTEMLNGKRDHYTVDKRYICNDGEILWGRQNLSVVRDAEGQPEYFIAMIEDITERKRMEESLRQSEERYRELFENANDIIYTHDLKGNFTSINRVAEQVTGYSLDEIIKMNIAQILPPESLNLAQQMITGKLKDGGRTEYELEVIAKDGHRVLLEVSTRLIHQDSKPVGVQGIARDITERKKMEEELIRLSDAVMMSTNSIVITDLEGNIVDVNAATLEMQGAKDKGDLIGHKPFDAIVPEDQGKAFIDLARVLEKGFVKDIQYRVITRDSRILLVETNVSLMKDSNGAPIGIVAVTRDITERKRMEEALRQSEEQFRALVENALDAIVVINGDGVITYASPSNERMLGYPLEQTIGMDGFSFARPEDMPGVVSAFTKLIEEPDKAVSVGLRIHHNDGSWRMVEAVAQNLLEDEAVKGIVINWRDITERKKAEEALRESEERLRLYFESVSDVIYSLDSEFKFVSISPSVERILGYKPEEMVGRSFQELNILTPDSLKRAFLDAMRVLGGEHVVSEGEFVAKNGQIIFGEINTTPLFSPQDEVIGMIGVARDITERKAMERELQQREQDYLIVLESAQEGMFVVDAETLKVVFGNRRASMMFGFDPELQDGIGANILDLVHPEDREIAIKGFVEDLPKLERRKRYEVRARTKDGREILISVLGTRIEFRGKVAVLLSAKDITERKKAEEALRLSERDYKVLFESTLDGLIVLEAETMKIVLANETAARISGVSSADNLIGLDPFEFLPIDNRDTARNIVREEVFEKDLHRIHEYRFYTAEGKEVWVSAVSTRTEYCGRKAALVSVRDITERKEAEEDKQKMEEQLRLAGRLAAVGELAAGVAHELNNPIAAVQGYAQLLTAKKDIDESVKKDVDIIYREAQRAGKITKNLLSFARRHEPEKRFISINEALEKTLELSAHQMKMNNIELEVELDPDLPRTMADFHQMQQIFVNIINNAEQAMLDAHGKGKLIAGTRKSGDMIEITFTDDGPGIAEENLKRIFDPFFTTKGVGKGTGLGLSICYGLVEAHNGHLYARSKLGEGATFIVEIPIVPEERPAAEAVFIKTKKGSARWRK